MCRREKDRKRNRYRTDPRQRIYMGRTSIGKRWRELSAEILATALWCEGVDGEPCPFGAPSEHVHHKIRVDPSDPRFLDPANLEALCRSCHAAIEERLMVRDARGRFVGKRT